jgi:hypothetical protein
MVHYIGEVYASDPEEARLLILRTLHDCGGVTTATARALGISRPYLNHLLRWLGINKVPAQIRAQLTARFRLPPLGERERPRCT